MDVESTLSTHRSHQDLRPFRIASAKEYSFRLQLSNDGLQLERNLPLTNILQAIVNSYLPDKRDTGTNKQS
jgi:hypothetical protein